MGSPGVGCWKLSATAYVTADGVRHFEYNSIKALQDVNGGAIHCVTYDKLEGILGFAEVSQAALRIK